MITGSLLTAPLIGEAQPSSPAPKRIRVVGLLAEDLRPLRVKRNRGGGRFTLATFRTFSPAEFTELELLLRQAVSPLKVETRSTAPAPVSLESLAGDLIESGAEVIVTIGTPATLAARKRTRTVPIVGVGVSDPVALGLAQSLSRPGGNVTGLSIVGPQLLAKGLDFIAQVVPGPQRVAILWNPSNAGAAMAIVETYSAARALGVPLFPAMADRPEALGAVLESLRHISPKALLVVNDAQFTTHSQVILEFAREARLPTMFQTAEWVERGGLMAYGPSLDEMQRRAVACIVRLLGGTRPEDVPIEEPTQLELVINRRTATALGLTIPPALLQLAEQVIE